MSDEQKPPKGWRWVEVGETITDETKLFTASLDVGDTVCEGDERVYLKPVKSGDKPVTRKWLNKHKKISWNIDSSIVNLVFNPPQVLLVFEDHGRLTKIPIENRRHLKKLLKALRLPFEKAN